MRYVENPTTADYRAAGLGYGLSLKNKEAYAERRRLQDLGIEKVRKMIEWAHTSYEKAKVDYSSNMRMYADITLNWSPERVLSTYKNFVRMCAFLNDDAMWKKLSRSERRFIAKAYEHYLDQRR